MPHPRTELAPVVACTVVPADALPVARVLVEDYLGQHPDHDFVVLVTDVAEPVSAGPALVVGYDWLGADTYLELATCGRAEELARAAAPLLVRRLLQRAEAVVLLPAWARVLAPLADLASAARAGGLAVVPTTLTPLPDDGLTPTPSSTGIGGLDPNLLAVGRDAKAFVDFWAEQTRQDLLAPARPGRPGRAERGWLDLVPAMFEHRVLRDPGLNLGYWNLHELDLAHGPDGTLTVSGGPARLLRFDGYDPDQPWLLRAAGMDRPRVLLSERPVLRGYCDDYRDRLLGHGYQADEAGYGFDTLPDGTPLTATVRGAYRAAVRAAELAGRRQTGFDHLVDTVPAHPFGPDGGAELAAWLAAPGSPAERAAGFNRLTMWLWADRVDLQVAFPRPLADHAEGYRNWCRTHGPTDGGLPVWALPTEPEPLRPPVPEFGVNIAGYLTAELGLGEMGRIVQRAVRHAQIPLASVVEDHSLRGLVRTALAEPDTTGRPVFGVSLLTVNADYTELLLANHPEVGHQRYRIGLWAWELEEFPAELHAGFGLVDEVWTVSEFCRAAIAAHTDLPVKVFPVPVADPGEPERAASRPGEPVQFLFAFDFNSTAGRKNPYGLVTAFQQAFPGRDDVRLVLKATNSHLHAGPAERLRCQLAGDPRITLLERYLSTEELAALYRDSDAYVSLHRSEGFGLTVAEAMIRGLPVIATDYSSTREFLDERVGWPVPHTMVKVGPGWTPYPAGGTWAEPDLAAAAAAMRTVADDPAAAARRGAAARAHLLRTRSMDTAAAWLRTQLTEAHRRWRDQPAAARTSTATGPLARAQRAVHTDADPNGPSRLPFAPALRRLVRRAIDHYDAHQREVHESLVDDFGAALTEAGQRHDQSLAAQEHRLADLDQRTRRQLAALTRRLARLEADNTPGERPGPDA